MKSLTQLKAEFDQLIEKDNELTMALRGLLASNRGPATAEDLIGNVRTKRLEVLAKI